MKRQPAPRKAAHELKPAAATPAMLAAIVESSEDAIISKNLNGTITTWNAAAERLLGYRGDEVVGQPVTRIIPPDLHAEEAALLERLRRGESIAHFETVRLARNGRRIPVSLSVSPVRDEAGAIIGASKILRNLSERRRAEEEISRQNAELQAQAEELARRNEELQQQSEELNRRNEELQQTTEELERQAEELQAQSEELHAMNLELNKRESMLQTILASLRDAGDERQVLTRICQALVQLAGEAAASAAVVEREGDQLVVRVHAGAEGLRQYRWPFASTFAALVTAQGRTAFVDDLAARPDLIVPEPAGRKFRSLLATPLRVNGRVVGAVEVYSMEPRQWTRQEFAIIEWGATQCAIALETVRLQHQLRQSAAAAQSQRQLLELVVNHLPAAVSLIRGSDMRIQLVNPAYQAIAPGKAMVGKTLDELWPETHRGFVGICRQVLATGQAHHAIDEPFKISRSAGGPLEEAWFSWSLFRVRLPGEEGWAILNTAWETTVRKRTELALQASERLYRAIGESIDYGIWICDAQGRNTYASQSFLELVGMTQDQCSEFGWRNVLHPEDAEATMAAWKECVRAGGPWYREHRFRGADGRWHPVLACGVPVRDERGEIACWAGINLDINRLKQTEEALRESEERFHTLADTIPNLAWWANGDGYITWYNRRWYEHTGTTPEQMEGWGWQSVHDPAMLPSVLERWRASIATGEPFEMEFPLRGADGRFRWFLTRVMPVRGADGKVLRWFGTNTDVSETREAREVLARSKEDLERLVAERTARLQELVEELEHFSYTITHDMRAPLRAMKGYGEVVTELCADCPQPEAMNFLRRIMTSADRMDALIRDALNYSQAVRQELPLEPVDAGALLRGMLDSYPELQPTRARIRLEGKLPVVMGNEAGLTQCFSNLLGNAVKFAKPGQTPEVRVWAEPREGWARIWVEDNGIGIPERMLPRVFDMFSRGGGTRDGTGIGLALVRKVIKRMGGRVGVESEEGKGSRFWLELKTAK